MTVYVDHARTRYGRMRLSHMMSDERDGLDLELESAAQLLGLKHEWKHKDHYDISEEKRAIAIHFGAVPITSRELVIVRKRKR